MDAMDGGFVRAAGAAFCVYPASEETPWELGVIHLGNMPCPTQAEIIDMPAMAEMPSFSSNEAVEIRCF